MVSQSQTTQRPRKRARSYGGPSQPSQAGAFGRTRGRSFRGAYWKNTRRSENKSNAALAKMLGDFMETKDYPCLPIDNLGAVPIQVLAKPTTLKFVMGNAVPGTYSSPAWTAMHGFDISQGTTKNQRVGDSVYLKKTHGTLTIDMPNNLHAGVDGRPYEFRTIVFRARQRGKPTGIGYDPDITLFKDVSGNDIGDYSAGIKGIDLLNLPINKSNWTVFMDKKFTLGPDGALDTTVAPGVYNGASPYPSTVTIPLNFNHERKVEWIDGDVEPSDYDFVYNVAIYASAVGRQAVATGWTANLRMGTQFMDP